MKFSRHNNGYTLLFAALTSAVVLGVAVFITSVSRKQFILSATARDSMFSIYNADSAMECAADAAKSIDPGTVVDESGLEFQCIGEDGDVLPDEIFFAPMNPPPANFNQAAPAFRTSKIVGFPDDSGCAELTFIAGENQQGNSALVVESKGYNLGDSITCPTISPRTVERAMRLIYE